MVLMNGIFLTLTSLLAALQVYSFIMLVFKYRKHMNITQKPIVDL